MGIVLEYNSEWVFPHIVFSVGGSDGLGGLGL